MTIVAGAYLGGKTYTTAEVRALRTALFQWLDENELTQDPILIEMQVQSHMMAGHKASDI